MKVARYYTRQDIRVEEMPVPKIGPGEILIQVKVCGLCGSDLMEWYVKTKAPEVLGHEPAGVVAEVGDGVTEFEVGDRVFVHHHVPCFTCHHCIRGHYTLCATFKATHLDPGGFAEYLRVPTLNVQRDVLKLPSDMSFEQGSQIEPLATCIRGIERAGLQPGDTVVVIGAGVTGLMNMQLANIYGAGRVIVTDFSPFRLEMARRLGADHVIDAREDVRNALTELNEERKADVVIVTAGSIKAMEYALTLAGGGSTVLFFAPSSPEETLSISPHQLLFSEISLVSTYSCTHIETRQALKLIQGGRVNVEELITHRFDLNGVGTAINLAAQAGESMKILITP
ncbi:MAG: zinc-dependent dehydrogenase [Anaerolineae bacterium]|nr:zinc-dependent dehydrogenase [Anaerolineae bacterium]